ncbi:MAG: N-acetylmuramoyl-L-alanine amidase [Gemmatimonadetes bacterium]|nr:N-acetylmuramoyl-L-alanine amidase [Gemmatimonadota bacterium]
MRIEDDKLVHDDGTPVPFRPSPNVGGALDPRYLVMHFTAGRSAEESINWLVNPDARASAHVVIGRDGGVTQLVPFDRVAWHAGRSQWRGLSGLNAHSIGIELDNAGRLRDQGDKWCAWFGRPYDDDVVMVASHPHENDVCGWHTYPEVQLEAALEVARAVVRHYQLEDIIGHEDIAPGRKVDPGPAFPMGSFKARIMGRDADAPLRYRTTAALNIRTGPGSQHERLPGSPLARGTVVEPVRTQGTWWLVDVVDEDADEGDLQGWVHSRWLESQG